MNALTVSEVEQVLAQPDVRDPIGLRDRAIMEVFCSTGVRRQELLNLAVHDIDAGRRLVLVRQDIGDVHAPGAQRCQPLVRGGPAPHALARSAG
jgi:site-specific recombinase XerD